MGGDAGQAFLVEGDSLLFDALTDPLLRWEQGGQFLHVIYTIEALLEKLSRNERNFHIVFFDGLASRWRDPAHKALRSVLIRHLCNHPAFVTKRFTGWWTDGFAAYLQRLRPSFVLVSDGEPSETGARNVPDLRYPLQAFTIAMLLKHVDCVRSVELSFPSDALFGFLMERKLDRKKLLSVAHPIFPPQPEQIELDAALLERLAAADAVKARGARGLVTAYAVARTLQEAKAAKHEQEEVRVLDLAKAHVLHAVLLEHLALPARAHAHVHKRRDVLSFLSSFYKHAYAALSSRVVPTDPSLTDLVDGRLLHTMIDILLNGSVSSLGLPAAVHEAVVQLWGAVAAGAGLGGKAAGLFPLLSVQASVPVSDEEAYAVPSEHDDAPSRLMAALREGAAAAAASIEAAASKKTVAAILPAALTHEEQEEEEDHFHGGQAAPQHQQQQQQQQKEEKKVVRSGWDDESEEEEEVTQPQRFQATEEDEEEEEEDTKPDKQPAPQQQQQQQEVRQPERKQEAQPAVTVAAGDGGAKQEEAKAEGEGKQEAQEGKQGQEKDKGKKGKDKGKGKKSAPAPPRKPLDPRAPVSLARLPVGAMAARLPQGAPGAAQASAGGEERERKEREERERKEKEREMKRGKAGRGRKEREEDEKSEDTKEADARARAEAALAQATLEAAEKRRKLAEAYAAAAGRPRWEGLAVMSSDPLGPAEDERKADLEAGLAGLVDAGISPVGWFDAHPDADRLQQAAEEEEEEEGEGEEEEEEEEAAWEAPRAVARLSTPLMPILVPKVEGALAKAKLEAPAEEVLEGRSGESDKWADAKELQEEFIDREKAEQVIIEKRGRRGRKNVRTTYAQRQRQVEANYMEKYTKTLVTNFKIALRDIVSTKEEEAEEKRELALQETGGRSMTLAKPEDEKDKDKDKKEEEKKKEKEKKGGKKGAGQVKEQAIAETLKRKQEEQEQNMALFVAAVEANNRTMEARIDKLDDKLLDHREPHSALVGLRKLLQWCLQHFKQRRKQDPSDFQPAVRLFMLCHDLFRRFKQHLTTQDMKAVQEAMLTMGFSDTAHEMAVWYSHIHNKTLKEVKLNPKDVTTEFSLHMSRARFQMMYAGPVMLRNVDSAPDDRVSGYYPDDWQRKLLDVVDARHSALVVAPTSSGKTMVSYYAMKQVFKENQTARQHEVGIVVYVCPSKALVNQVAAEVFLRKLGTWAIYTPDWWSANVLDANVVITVPDCLENLLLLPGRESWVKRIRYVIFDEVHMLGEAGGEVWERLLVLITCPFLALSATVGNPEHFHLWLEKAQAAHGRPVHLIEHKQRWSDLEHYMYLPSQPIKLPAIEDSEAKGIVDEEEEELDEEAREKQREEARQRSLITNPAQGLPKAALSWKEQQHVVSYSIDLTQRGPGTTSYPAALTRVHPCAALALDPEFRVSGTFPPDLPFLPSETIALYDALVEVARQFPDKVPQARKDGLAALAPEAFFKRMYIEKRMAVQYEEALKAECTAWIKDGLYDLLSIAFKSLSEDVHKSAMRAQEVRKAYVNGDREFVRKHFLPMMLEMHATDRLPCIAFTLDQDFCKTLVLDTLYTLEAMERKKWIEEGNPRAWGRTKEEKLAEKQEKEQRRQRDEKKTKKQLEEELRAASDRPVLQKDDGRYKPDPRFSFVREGEQMPYEDMQWWLNRLKKKTGWKDDAPLIRALYRGIGIHHPGLYKQYTDLVEAMFRGKHLKIVVATQSLALGVNMPARSVIFVDDSRHLTPLTYKQMSGRAGRRGYDNVGHVIFLGPPAQKVFRLLKAPIQRLRGHFPLNPTLFVRMLLQFEHSQDRQYTARAIARVLRDSYWAWGAAQSGKAHLSEQLAYHFRYSLDFLLNSRLISNRAGLTPWTRLCAHLWRSEPANFALVALVESGLVRKGMSRMESRRAAALALLEVLCHLVARVPLPATWEKNNFGKNLRPDTVAVVPELPRAIQNFFDKMNRRTLDVYTAYVRTFALAALPHLYSDEAKNRLPASLTPFNGRVRTRDEATLVGALVSKAIKFDARSPFVALSGHGDYFHTAQELAGSVREGIHLEPESIPVVEQRDRRGRRLRLNAYALDFYRHGEFDTMLEENRLEDNFAWHQLKKIDSVLQKMTDALKLMSREGDGDVVVQTFLQLHKWFNSAFEAISVEG